MMMMIGATSASVCVAGISIVMELTYREPVSIVGFALGVLGTLIGITGIVFLLIKRPGSDP